MILIRDYFRELRYKSITYCPAGTPSTTSCLEFPATRCSQKLWQALKVTLRPFVQTLLGFSHR